MKRRIKPFLAVQVLAVIYGIASNLVHPITPTLNRMLGLEKYMFGVMFAAMALGSFLFSAFWGLVSDRRGRKLVLVITLLGYAVTQLAFGYTANGWLLVLLRFVSGCFTGGTSVVLMAVIIDISEGHQRTRRLTAYAAASSVSSSIGFFVGGLIGVVSFKLVFWVQFLGLALGALLALGITPQNGDSEHEAATPHLKYASVLRMLPLPMLLFFGSVALANFGTYGYDNVFNNLITHEFAFPTWVNGTAKMVTGLLGLIANLALNPWLLKRMPPQRALLCCLGACALILLFLTPSEGAPLFFSINCVFFMANAMYMPIQQTLVGQDARMDFGLMSGMFYAVRSLGMVAGSLTAGVLYAIQGRLPIFVTSIGFLLAALLTLLGMRAQRKAATSGSPG